VTSLALDVRTLMIIMSLLRIVSAVALWGLYRLHSGLPGLRNWAVGMALMAVGAWLIFMRGLIPPFLSIAIANCVIIVGYATIHAGIRQFIGLPPQHLAPSTIILLVATAFLLLYDRSDTIASRIVAISSGAGLFSLMVSRDLMLSKSPTTVGWRISSLVFAVHGCVNLMRVVWVILDPPNTADSMQWGASSQLLYTWSIIAAFAVTASLALMTSERLRNDLASRLHELDAARQRAEQMVAEQRNFVAMLSHEFRTPLAIIGASAELVSCNIPAADCESAEELGRIRRASSRLAGLVDGLLSDEWLETASETRCSQDVDLCAILTDLAAESGIRLNLELSCPLKLDADGDLLPVAISNLIDNARKYGRSRDGIQIRGLPWGKDEVAIEVIDDGPGIDPAELPRIFEKFYRPSSTKNQAGSGLGLYLVKRITDLHGGRVEIDQTSGTVFRIVMPLKAGHP